MLARARGVSRGVSVWAPRRAASGSCVVDVEVLDDVDDAVEVPAVGSGDLCVVNYHTISKIPVSKIRL